MARRVLLNFRCEPSVARRLVPEPLEIAMQNGAAIVGVCLIRLERLRPKGMPALFVMAAENMAHRIAIRYPAADVMKDGVFIWRRETDRIMMSLLGGRLFPGVQQSADFEVVDNKDVLTMTVLTKHHETDVSFVAKPTSGWKATPAFATFGDASDFLRRGDCGFSCALNGERLEGMRLRTLRWLMTPLAASEVSSAFYENEEKFPRGSVEFDSALLMRGVPHEWHELSDVPELASPQR